MESAVMPHFDMTITLGNIVAALSFLFGIWAAMLRLSADKTRLYVAMDQRLAVFESVLSAHAGTLTTHSARMEKLEDQLVRLVGDIQRIAGHIESSQVRALAEAAAAARNVVLAAEAAALERVRAADEHRQMTSR
jgi:uncharacterized coiled-coil protein SlyX